MKKFKLNKTISFSENDLKELQMLIKSEDEIAKMKLWNFEDLNNLTEVRGHFMKIILNHLIVKK